MLSAEDGEELLRQFPPVEAAFAYGSGVVTQTGYDYSSDVKSSDLPMVDLIFVVNDSCEWHEKNIILNPSHYSTPFPVSSDIISYLQDNTGAGMWYNPMIPMNIRKFPYRQMKYGVISRKKFLEDLLDWKYLYVAGRLHKPVLMLKSYPHIDHAILRNRENAVRTALLLLPSKFTEVDLYLTIAGLSYLGDPRMGVGENPKKVENLVTSAMSHYRSIYEPALKSVTASANLTSIGLPSPSDQSRTPYRYSIFDLKTIYSQNTSPSTRWELCESLPTTMRRLLLIRSRSKYVKRLIPPKNPAIRTALASIVARAATTQSLKGLASAGLVKCTMYLYAKLTKRFGFGSSKPSSRPLATFYSTSP